MIFLYQKKLSFLLQFWLTYAQKTNYNDSVKSTKFLKLFGYQMFLGSFMNPNTAIKRILVTLPSFKLLLLLNDNEDDDEMPYIQNNNICIVVNINPIKFGIKIKLSFTTYSLYKTHMIAFNHEIKLVKNGNDIVDFSIITVFITANGEPDTVIDKIHAIKPINERF